MTNPCQSFNGTETTSAALWLVSSRHPSAALSSHGRPSLITDIDSCCRLLFVLRVVNQALLDVGSEAVESFVDIDVALGRHLEEGDAQFVCQRLTTLRRDHALFFPVALVSDEDLVDAFSRVLFYICEPSSNV